MLDCFVLLDLETTGGNPLVDRITEIAAVRIEHGEEVARWSTLVNPGVRIPPYIQQLTGISDAMVAQAPSFGEVATQLMSLLDGAVLVAHNVRFDHGFLMHALAREEHALKVRTLCTVRLSRMLYPQHKGHGLDAILQRHGLQTQARHRAMGDVDVVLQWLHIARQERGEDALRAAAQKLLQGSASLPPQLHTDPASIPESPGVYLFYGEGQIPLYIGKSIHLRSRVMSHFQAASKVAREMRILNEIRRIEWHCTAGELGALLLESRLVKELQPLHNRKLRRERDLLGWHLRETGLKPVVELVSMNTPDIALAEVYGVYRSRRQATEALRNVAQTQGLCLQWLGLESGKGPCFGRQIGRCKGACTGDESPALLRVRLQMVLAGQRLQAWPFAGRIGIREHDATTGRTDIHVFDQWCHIATVHDESALAEAATERQSLAFDLDTYRLLLGRLHGAQRQIHDVFLLQSPPTEAQ